MVSKTVNVPPSGVTAELYRAAIGPRGQDYYLRHFARFDADGKTSTTWHWPAYWSTLNWLVYRRMWGWALAYVAAMLGLALLIFGVGKLVFSYSDTTGLMLFLMLLTGAFILPGLYANAWFYTYCNEKISAVLRSTHEIKDACQALADQASNNKRWFGLASVNVALMALLAGMVTFVLNPEQDKMQMAKVRPALSPPAGAAMAVVAPANLPRAESQIVLAQATEPPSAPPSEANPTPPVKFAEPASANPDSPPPPAQPSAVSIRTDEVQPSAVTAAPAVNQAEAARPAKSAPKPAVAAKATQAGHVWFVQVGAFAKESNVQNVRARVEEAGLQTSTEPIDTPASVRLTRVRAGPFDSRAEADKAALRLKALDLPTVLIRQ
jgi:cell division protein FtsN